MWRKSRSLVWLCFLAIATTKNEEIVNMKLILATAACMLFSLCHPALGQETNKVQEPEFLGTFFSLDSTTGNLSPLERQTAMHKIVVKAMGFGGGVGYFELSGEKSPVRFKEGEQLNFIVLVSSQKIDPQGIIQLFSWESKKGKRQLTIDKAGSMGLGGKSLIQKSLIAFHASKYGASSFKVTPAENLPPGEYTLQGPDNKDSFCFGIDKKISPK